MNAAKHAAYSCVVVLLKEQHVEKKMHDLLTAMCFTRFVSRWITGDDKRGVISVGACGTKREITG